MKEDTLYKIYRRRFQSVYGEYIALIGDKPEQILIEETNILGHLAQYHNATVISSKKEENLEKAFSHLSRATLDLHKLVWAQITEMLHKYIVKNEKYITCFVHNEALTLSLYNEFLELGRKARKGETNDIGVSPLRSSARYYKAINFGYDRLLRKFDEQKKAKLDSWIIKYKAKEYVIGFVLGFIANIIVATIFS